jgi:hypothetical protein
MARERKRITKVGLGDKMRAQLETLARKSNRSLADEIRHRVGQTLLEEHLFDDTTRSLALRISQLANDVATVSGVLWHQHPAARAVLAEAIVAWLEDIEPSRSGQPIPPELEKPDYNPRNIGKAIARMRRHAETEDTSLDETVQAVSETLTLEIEEAVERKIAERREARPRPELQGPRRKPK